MMKKLLVTLVAILTCCVGYAQIPKRQSLKNFSTWSLSPYASTTFENMDIEENDPFYKRTPINIGWGAELSKQLSHYSSIQVNYFSTDLQTDVPQFSYKTKLNQLDFRLRLNITNGFILKNWSNTQLYGYIGYGVLWYDAKQTTLRGVDSTITSKGKTRVVPIGVGGKYRLGNKTSVFADMSYNASNSDKLDTWVNDLTSKDGYTKFTVGLTYNIGKKKILEWDNPFVYLVPDEVHDTTVVIQKIEVAQKVADPIKPDSAVIYYLTGSSSIEAPYLRDLDEVLTRAKHNGYKVKIQSYCDASGSSKTNLEVITKRADRVLNYVKKFIDDDNIIVEMYDESYALYAPEARNRKVIVSIVK